jgi:restriction system protein
VSQQLPEILLQAAIVETGERTSEGVLVTGVAVAWFEIARQLKTDPAFLYTIHWRKLEELIAGAYERDGWQVILTPRSGDRGRDIIATRTGFGSIRIVDQVKAYSRGHVVTADQVLTMVGVLERDQNVSKGVVTTTSVFAPGIEKDEALKRLMPYRLELVNGSELIERLVDRTH